MNRITLTAALWALTATVTTAAQEPLTLPLHDSFLPENPVGLGDENPRWQVIDNNNDGYMYAWTNRREAGADGTTGFAMCQTNKFKDTDDYLMTHPIAMEAGMIHVSFYYAGGDDSREAMEVLFGKSSEELSALSQIIDLPEIQGNKWRLCSADIPVTEDGEYVIAFHSKSTTEGFQVRIDEVDIDYGAYVKTPDIEITGAKLPMNGSALESPQNLSVTVANCGLGTADGFTASYTINGGAKTEERFANVLAPGESVTVTFSKAADLSAPDTRYDIMFEAYADNDLASHNNTCAGTVRHLSPRSVPYSVKFSEKEADALDLYWWPTDIEGTGWKLNSQKQYRPDVLRTIPLVSGSFALEPTTYRLTMKICAGSWGWPENQTSDFNIRIGRNGTDISEWETIADVEDLYTNDVSQKKEYLFDIDSEDNYSIAVTVTDGGQFFTIDEVQLDIAYPDDVAIEPGLPFTLPAVLPAKQAGSFTYPVVIRNNGHNTETVTLAAYAGEEAVGTSDPVTIEPDNKETVALSINMPDATAGENIELTFRAEIEAEDATIDDNSFKVAFKLSDDILSYDNISDYTQQIGGTDPTTSTVGYGKVFHMLSADVLSGVDLVLAARENTGIPFQINVYSVGNENIGRLIGTSDHVRSTGEGTVRFGLPPMRLEAGDYMIEIVSPKGTSLGLCYETAEDGNYHMRRKWDYSSVYFNPDEIYEISGGNLGIRPVFENGATASAVDLEAVRFITPATDNLMLENEPISVEFNSLGYKELKNINFNCFIDGIPVAAATVETIAPYQRSFTVDFTADLTALGEHTITVSPSVENDVTPGNNIITTRVSSLPEADRYKLDFESCIDFSTDRLNPSWLSVDRDGGVTGGYIVGGFSVYWPGKDTPAGFVAFNPDMTIPASTGFFTDYTGNRFGASFFIDNGEPNDDWLISPPLQLGDNPLLQFSTKSHTDKYGLEEYYVLVSPDGGTEPDDFIAIGDLRYAPAEWTTVRVDLSDYANTAPRVAIRCVSQDKMVFMVDDIEVFPDYEENSVGEIAADGTFSYDNDTRRLHVESASTGNVIAAVEIVDLSGIRVEATQPNSPAADMNLSALPCGVYVCRVILSDGQTTSRKIMIR